MCYFMQEERNKTKINLETKRKKEPSNPKIEKDMPVFNVKKNWSSLPD